MNKKEVVELLRKKNKELSDQCDKAKKTIRKHIQQSLGYCSEEEAKDMLQKALLVFLKKPDTFVLTSQFSTLLVGIAKKLWSKELDDRKKRNLYNKTNFEEHDNNFEQTRIEEEKMHEKLIKLKKFLASLSEGCRKIFKLRYQENKSHKEIAAILGITEVASRVKLSRCRDKIPE